MKCTSDITIILFLMTVENYEKRQLIKQRRRILPLIDYFFFLPCKKFHHRNLQFSTNF